MLDIKVAYEPFKNANIEYAMSLKVLESVRFFSRGQKVLRLKKFRTFLSIESEYVRPSAAADFACSGTTGTTNG
jgi:hypothetical protein